MVYRLGLGDGYSGRLDDRRIREQHCVEAWDVVALPFHYKVVPLYREMDLSFVRKPHVRQALVRHRVREKGKSDTGQEDADDGVEQIHGWW